MSESGEEKQRERYQELLREVRTVLPGAQVLFAFLLTVPFSTRFEQVDQLGKYVFTASLLSVAAATILFMAPTAYHRLTSHEDRSGRLRFGVGTVLAGLLFLGVSATCAVFVVTRFLFDSLTSGSVAAVVVAAFATLMWLVLPVSRRA